jgi:hypothetical protein
MWRNSIVYPKAHAGKVTAVPLTDVVGTLLPSLKRWKLPCILIEAVDGGCHNTTIPWSCIRTCKRVSKQLCGQHSLDRVFCLYTAMHSASFDHPDTFQPVTQTSFK